MNEGYASERKESALYLTIHTLYEQQKYMYDTKTYSVDRIVSITQPWLRPIVRGKAKAPACSKQSNDIRNGRGTIRKEYWQIRYTGSGITGISAEVIKSGCQGRSLEDPVKMQKQIKNKSMKIKQIGLKWREHSA